PPTLPPRELFARFQEDTRLVYLTGERDMTPLAMDGASLDSMRKWCVFDVDAETTPGAGHELASAAAFGRALRALLAPPPPEARKLAACRAGIARDLETELGKVRSLIAAGHREAAQKELSELDRRFGGLAAPDSLALQEQLSGP